MSFGIYVHIPYCLQRCSYCDFATYEQSQILPPSAYVDLILDEVRQKSASVLHLLNSPQGLFVDTIYFGGGTPSLIPPQLIVSVLDQLTRFGFSRSAKTEVTIEINPATIDHSKMEIYLAAGVNRFSVGAQTFDDPLLKSVRREHNAAQTRETLRILKDLGVNFSLDLLFALPGQNLHQLNKDLDEILAFQPPHVSPYCLTVPEGHPLNRGRPEEDVQLEMFAMIQTRLAELGLERYEISNFAKPGFESRHNSLYWSDDSYWGLGLSSHSYDRSRGWGVRYWNPNNIEGYQKLILSTQSRTWRTPEEYLKAEQFENLKCHQSLTDFCHTSLRRREGLFARQLKEKFGETILTAMQGALAHLVEDQLIRQAVSASEEPVWTLTEQGVLVSNQVFGRLTFLEGEIPAARP